MGERFNLKTVVLRVVFSISVCVLAQMSYASWKIQQLNDVTKPELARVPLWNPFSVDGAAELNALNDKMSEPLRHLQFMTFKEERKREAKKVIAVLREKLKLRPFDTRTWSQLVLAEADADIAPQQRLWTMESAHELGAWNDRYRIRLAGQCVQAYDLLLRETPELCIGLLSSLGGYSTRLTWQYMGVQSVLMTQVLNKFEQEYAAQINNSGKADE